jgi:3-hydroxy-D-aspartate aldolase
MNDFMLHTPLIGQTGSRFALNTPCLVIDVDALDRNIDRMAALAHASGLKLRPHAKTHKSVDLACRQMAAGAVGICCAKIGEAEALAEGAIGGLLLTSPVVAAAAIQRLVALRRRVPDLAVVVDHPANVAALAQAMDDEVPATTLQVLIDIDPGFHRTGVASAADAVTLSRTIRAHRSLQLIGVQFYCGSDQHIEHYAERLSTVGRRIDYLKQVIEALTIDGAAPAVITGGGTGTHRIDAALGVFTELQVGSYVFMDEQYRACDLDESATPFDMALFVDSRVVSVNAPGLVTVDAGLKAFAAESVPPGIVSGAPPGSRYEFMGDEHGALILPDGADAPRLDDVVIFSTPHCDPTVNLYDTYHVVSGDTLVALWPVSARGRSR